MITCIHSHARTEKSFVRNCLNKFLYGVKTMVVVIRPSMLFHALLFVCHFYLNDSILVLLCPIRLTNGRANRRSGSTRTKCQASQKEKQQSHTMMQTPHSQPSSGLEVRICFHFA